ncbi:uncharacterized protein TRAVEDRAFT_19438 [Trametes versicolor FP-101664 SS1]|uniref:uncharacterized protein n=1 Tax=Trametes versicolor (strain FP-101664) TaxID=717944 RepID=UPI0004622132|nr:uncharacterized protein TRAVEDRAFT_19438 [Trametes versicolor FP-101664 SS1]EIW60900.1 hypothetical protein TRAVEDRAFT_19438 [Trametes versicolor FP-101664 SS1]
MSTSPRKNNKSARVQADSISHKSRHVNGASKPRSTLDSFKASAKRPAPPGAPPRPYVPPPLPLSDELVASEYQKVLNGPADSRDASFGQALAQLLGALPRSGNGQYNVKEAAAQNYLTKLGLYAQPRLTNDFPPLYKVGGHTSNKDSFPAVFLKNANAPYVERTTVGNHGFAYMTSEVCKAVCECGTFHLFVYRQYPYGQELPYPWRYCGLFCAHKIGYKLSTPGWERLSDEAKKAAAETHCVSLHGGDRASATPENILRYQQEFRIRAVEMPLVLLECVEFPYGYGRALLSEDCQHSVAIKRTLTKAIPKRADIERDEAAKAQVKDKARRAEPRW